MGRKKKPGGTGTGLPSEIPGEVCYESEEAADEDRVKEHLLLEEYESHWKRLFPEVITLPLQIEIYQTYIYYLEQKFQYAKKSITDKTTLCTLKDVIDSDTLHSLKERTALRFEEVLESFHSHLNNEQKVFLKEHQIMGPAFIQEIISRFCSPMADFFQIAPLWGTAQMAEGGSVRLLQKPPRITRQEKLYSLPEAAEVLGMNREVLRRHVVKGKVNAVKIGRDWKIKHAEILKIKAKGLQT